MNAAEKKDRAEKLFNQDVLVRQNYYIELLIEHDDSFFDEITNYFTKKCPGCGEVGLEDLEPNDDDEYECYCCDKKFEHLADLELEPKEVYEWYAVSEYLAMKLEAIGEVVYETPDSHIWGRTCTGQSILSDPTLHTIVENMCMSRDELHARAKAWKVTT